MPELIEDAASENAVTQLEEILNLKRPLLRKLKKVKPTLTKEEVSKV